MRGEVIHAQKGLRPGRSQLPEEIDEIASVVPDHLPVEHLAGLHVLFGDRLKDRQGAAATVLPDEAPRTLEYPPRPIQVSAGVPVVVVVVVPVVRTVDAVTDPAP